MRRASPDQRRRPCARHAQRSAACCAPARTCRRTPPGGRAAAGSASTARRHRPISIVAAGANACLLLHYRAGSAAMHDGELVLIDAGCELRRLRQRHHPHLPGGRALHGAAACAVRAGAGQPGLPSPTTRRARFTDPHAATVAAGARPCWIWACWTKPARQRART